MSPVPPSSPSSDHKKHHQIGAQSPGEFRSYRHFPGYPGNYTTQSIPGQQVMSVASWPPGGARLHKGPTWIGPNTLTSSKGRLTLAIHIYIYIHIYICKLFSRVQLSATPWTVALQAPLFMGFSMQEHWSGLPFPSPGIFQTQG